MKKIIYFFSIVVIILIQSSCKDDTDGIMDYTDYQVENKLDKDITIQLISQDSRIQDFSVAIPSNSTKRFLFGVNSGPEGVGMSSFKSVIVYYNNLVLKDSLEEGNSFLNPYAYKQLPDSKYKSKKENNILFTVDAAYVQDHIK